MPRTITQAQAEEFAALATSGTEEGKAAYMHYSKMLRRAIEQGRVGLYERIVALYPIVVDVNDEIDEINEAWAEEERRCRELDGPQPDNFREFVIKLGEVAGKPEIDFESFVKNLLVQMVEKRNG